MLHIKITDKFLITGMMILFLVSGRTWAQQPEHESVRQHNLESAAVVVKAGQPVVHHLADIAGPKKISIADFKPPRKTPAHFFIPMKNFNTEQGLAMSSILCGFKDHNGILWFGTSGNGVSEYDGQSFTNFTSSNGLIHNLINCITEDRHGNIWFGTYGGISVYDGRSFINYTTEQGLPDNDVNKILEDNEGNIWIGSTKGLSLKKASGNGNEPVKFINFTQNDGLNGQYLHDILQDKNGTIWVSTEAGVLKYTPGQTRTFTDVFQQAGIKSQAVEKITEDHDGVLWLTTTKGVIRFDPSGQQAARHFTTNDGLINNDIRCSQVDAAGTIWFGTSEGVSAFNKKENSFFNLTTEEGLSHNIICSITEDDTGSLWFGTLGGGLCRYDGKGIVAYTKKQGFPSTVVYAVTEDKKGNLWFGGHDSGITELTFPEKGLQNSSFINYTTKQGLPDDYTIVFLTDHNGNLWMGSHIGLNKLMDGSIYTYTTQQGLVNDYVVCLEEDQQGNIWIGTYAGGVSKFDGRSFTNFTTEQGLVHNTVWDIMEDKKGNFWFATRGGLSIFNGKNFINFTTAQGLPDNKLSSVIEDQSGNILIGTWGSGISVIRKNRVDQLTDSDHPELSEPVFENYSTNDGLSNNVVYNILEDSVGNIFIGSNEGITVLKGGLDATGKNLAKSGLENFNEKSGYPIKDISNNYSFFLDSRGIIWAGTGDKLVRFDYSKMHYSTKSPGIIIRNVKINHENISWYSLQKDKSPEREINSGITAYQNHEQLMYGKFLNESERDTLRERLSSIRFDSITPFYGVPLNLVLPYAFNSISFDFVGVETRRSFLVKYQYKLEGYNDEWSHPTNSSSAIFGNLPPGEYTFLVKAQRPDGVWSEPAAYQFEILPPSYRTWPAFILYGFLLIFGIYIVDRIQRRRLIARERQRAMQRELEQAKEIEKSYLELKVAQNQLIQAEKMASLGELTAGIAHEIQNPLNFVNNFSEVSSELVHEINEEIEKGNLDEVKEITANLVKNLEIISQHGKRASNIVKGMLEHSRSSKGEKRAIDINALADEFLKLSYHGLRVKDKSFNSNFKMEADANLPKVNVLPQDIGRVLLNLINNAFYAVNEKAKQNIEGYKPEVVVSTSIFPFHEDHKGVSYSHEERPQQVFIRIRDNGSGIPDEIRDKIFQPFFTTKPSGSGTGLGLSLSYDIIKAHGGELNMKTEENKGTEFIIQLPIKSS